MKEEFLQGWRDAAGLINNNKEKLAGSKLIGEKTKQHFRLSWLIYSDTSQKNDADLSDPTFYSPFHKNQRSVPPIIGECLVDYQNMTGIFCDASGDDDGETREVGGYITFSNRRSADSAARRIAAKLERYFQEHFFNQGEVIVYAELELSGCTGNLDKPTAFVRDKIIYNEGFDGVNANDEVTVLGEIA